VRFVAGAPLGWFPDACRDHARQATPFSRPLICCPVWQCPGDRGVCPLTRNGQNEENYPGLFAFVGAIGFGCGGAQAPVNDQSKQSDEQPTDQAAETDEAKAAEQDKSGTPSDEEKPSEETKASSAAESDSDTEEGAGKCNQSSSQLSLSVDRASVNLDQGRLEASMDGPVCKVVLTITANPGCRW